MKYLHNMVRTLLGLLLLTVLALGLAALFPSIGQPMIAASMSLFDVATPTPPSRTPIPRIPTTVVPLLPTSTPGKPVVPQPVPTSTPLLAQTGSGYRAENIRILGEKQLTRNGQFVFFPVSWSPDGARFAASRQTGEFVGNSEGTTPITEIWLLNLDGSNGYAVTKGHLPIWSRDGKMIAFSRFVFRGDQIDCLELQTVNLSTQEIKTLSRNAGYQQFDWLASGHTGILALDREVIAVDWDGSELRSNKTMDFPLPAGAFFKISPDGRWMALGSRENQNLWLLDLAATDSVDVKIQLSSNFEGLAAGPTWSPTGHYLAFGEFDGSLHIVTSGKPDRGHVVPTSGRGKPHWLSWSPDEQSLMFALDGNLYVVNADGSNLRQLTTTGQYDFPVWSPSGTQIAFEKFDHNLWILDIDDDHSSDETLGGTK